MWVNSFRLVVSLSLFVVFDDVTAAVGDYTHEWAVRVDGGEQQAQLIADQQNYELVDKVFPDVFVFRHRRLAKRSLRPSAHHHRSLSKHPKVSWAQQQRVVRRVKRDYSYNDRHYTNAYNDLKGHPTTAETILNDPQWPQMWYLNRGSGLDMRVQEAWAEGVTGKGIVATILDDGLEKGHPDIIKNYDPDASYDVNNRDADPVPRYDLIDTNRHGTRCAGEVAADANNSICAVGVAYEASIGGVRMLDGDVTDAVEARSLALNPQHIDIYSASWGPDDDGKTVDGPGELATRAFVEGINNGRNGHGSIFIWASGNGGRAQDNCNCDGYTNAIWTLSISSATEHGNVPWYSEACSSTLATTYSSGSTGERKIITTDLHHECTTTHTGTSASAPLAAGIVALALEVNRNLTWRDMQHIVVRTARPDHLDTTDWQTNGVGRKVSHRFGYGLMDAYAMVKLARNWLTVAPQRSCEVQAPKPHEDKLIPQKSYVTLKLEVSSCPGVMHLEHVQAMVSLSADRRGDLEIYLISPAGTKSTLLAQRPHDSSRAGFHSWPFMTVHMWGESPLGIWTLEIHNNGHFYINGKVSMKDFTLVLHGTEVEPGKPAPDTNFPSSNNNFPINHVTHQDLTHHTDKDSNTQRHNPTEYHDNTPHSTDDQYNHHQYQEGSTTPSSASKPEPLLVSLGLTEEPSSVKKKAGVEDGGLTHEVPVPVQLPSSPSSPTVGELPLDCLKLHPNTSACIDCVPGRYLYQRTCVLECPAGHYGPPAAGHHSTGGSRHNVTGGSPGSVAATAGGHCSMCHFSCKHCSGPDENQCLECWEDGKLHVQHELQTCVAASIAVYQSDDSSWRHPAMWLMMVAGLVIGLLAVVVCCIKVCCYNQASTMMISGGVNKLRNIKEVLNGEAKKTSKTGAAAYRKLSDDTDKLVNSNRPFYDYSSSSGDEEIS